MTNREAIEAATRRLGFTDEAVKYATEHTMVDCPTEFLGRTVPCGMEEFWIENYKRMIVEALAGWMTDPVGMKEIIDRKRMEKGQTN